MTSITACFVVDVPRQRAAEAWSQRQSGAQIV
jgi:hypothetical protein